MRIRGGLSNCAKQLVILTPDTVCRDVFTDLRIDCLFICLIDFDDLFNLSAEITIEQMEPERLFSWRWHPNAIDPKADYSAEPTTLVVFELEEAPDGTLLTVVESGFEGIPLARRGVAYRGNEQGWTAQMKAIETYVGKADSART